MKKIIQKIVQFFKRIFCKTISVETKSINSCKSKDYDDIEIIASGYTNASNIDCIQGRSMSELNTLNDSELSEKKLKKQEDNTK